MKKYFKITVVIVLIVFLIQICVSTIKIQKKNKTIQVNSDVNASNTKIEWGIKRESNHKQPDLGKKNKELIEKYNGLAMGNSNEKNIYLTFDLGYEAGYTEKILDTLKENSVPAAFFITGHYLNTASDLVERMISEGHIVGNHTVNHYSMPNLSNEQIKNELINLHTQIQNKFNYSMKYMRPPKGEYSENVLNQTNKIGYVPVMWSFAYADWDEKKQPLHEDAINKIIDNTHKGEIMLLHATSKTNMEVLDTVIKQIKGMEYEFKSLDEFER